MHVDRRIGLLVVAIVLVAAGALVGIGSGRSKPPGAGSLSASERSSGVKRQVANVAAPRPVPPLVVTAPAHPTASWTTVAKVHGQPAAWLAQRSGVTLVRFDQMLVHLDLHAGSSDGGVSGWRYGDQITPAEIHGVIAAVNGGFKLTYPNVGFMSGGRVAATLKAGLASIVTYTDGTTDIGTWRAGVPSAGKAVFSVLQNQRLLVDNGVVAASAARCILACWGETVGNRTTVARSALGITAQGQLVWAAGEELLPAELASALSAAGALRAIELDINPDWVAGYLYIHHPPGPTPTPIVPGQLGIAGKLLEPYSRDFLTFVAKRVH